MHSKTWKERISLTTLSSEHTSEHFAVAGSTAQGVEIEEAIRIQVSHGYNVNIGEGVTTLERNLGSRWTEIKR